MTTDVAADGGEVESQLAARQRRRRQRGGGHSLLAQGEPVIWLNGAGLVICFSMIVLLLLLVVYQGATTFWPGPLMQFRTLGDQVYLGEVARHDRYVLGFGTLATLSGPRREAAARLLYPRLREKLARIQRQEGLAPALETLSGTIEQAITYVVRLAPQVREATAVQRDELLGQLAAAFDGRRGELPGLLAERLLATVSAAEDGTALDGFWAEMRSGEEAWLSAADVPAMVQSLRDDPGLLEQLWGHHALLLLSNDVGVPMQRRLVRTGNYELTNEHFNWVSDFEILPDGQSQPPWALVLERLTWGRFYGEPQALLIDGQEAATQPDAVWASFLEHHPRVRARWRERRQLEIVDTGEVNRALEAARLELRDVELREGKNSAAWRAAEAAFQQRQTALEAEFADIRSRIQALDAENERYQLRMATAQGEQKSIALADVVRAYPANQLSWSQRVGTYAARWAEFLWDDPREANSEGGVFPAIWGTVAMTLLMSVAVVPLGVLAALYLREYAKAGLLVSVVRIAVNNLAGVPSIVFGVFGLGFFCYIIGASLDQLFFSAKLPNPTFGTGGLMWAALTLALLTLPVVIVATEEALAAVPRSMREGSLACGATKFQTIRRIVLPRAMPGIMTGMILAMARGAGEVAPLMLVGAVKLAPELPVDGHFPFVHLERSFMHLGFHIYDLGFQSQNSEAAKPMVFTTTLLLIALIALMNLIAIGLRARLRRKFRYTEL